MGNAVNETVVYAFMALFVVNVVVTAIGIRMTVKQRRMGTMTILRGLSAPGARD